MKKNMKKNRLSLRLTLLSRTAPLLSDMLVIIAMCIPCMRFALDGKLQQSFSIFGFIANAWRESRHYLFSASIERTAEGILFYRTVFIVLVVSAVLFVLGIALDIWSVTVRTAYFKSSEPSDKIRKAKNIYTAVIPNRILLSAARLTLIPLIVLPDIVEQLYRRVLLYNVNLRYSILCPWAVSVILFSAVCLITMISKRHEKAIGEDIFERPRRQLQDDLPTGDEENDNDGDRPELRRMKSAAVAEQTERLRALLGYTDESDDGGENEDKE